MEITAKQAISHLKLEILPGITDDLREHQQELAEGGIDNFYETAMPMAIEAEHELCQLFQNDGVDDFGEEIATKVRRCIVGALNGVLPVEHPYIVSLVEQPDEPLEYMALYRHKDPALAELLTRNVVPVLHLQEDEDPESGGKLEVIYPPDSLRSNSF